VKDEKNLESASSVLLSSQVEEAKKQLTDLRLEETLGSELITNLADPQGSQLRYSALYGMLLCINIVCHVQPTFCHLPQISSQTY
jgi:hypothetical protein